MHLLGMDAVIHLAALPGVRSRSTQAALRAANVELTDRLAAASARQGTRFVFVSSSSIYGNASVLPTPEHSPLRPINPYAASKVAAEQAVLAHGGDPVIVRPFTVYGPGQRPDMAFARWIAAMRTGEPIPWHAGPGTARDFTYVDDAVEGLIAALRHGRSREAYNISGWRSVQLRDALELLGAPAVRELPCSTAEALVTSGCRLKAAAELGYAPGSSSPRGSGASSARSLPLRLLLSELELLPDRVGLVRDLEPLVRGPGSPRRSAPPSVATCPG